MGPLCDSLTPLSLDIPKSFKKLLVDCVIPNAAVSEANEFRKVLFATDMRAMYKKYEVEIGTIFQHYSGRDEKGAAADHKRSINFSELEMMVKDLEVFANKISVLELKKISGSVQLDDEVGEIDEDEFSEILCVLSIYHDPSPYMPIVKRLEFFLTRTVFPGLKEKIKLLKVRMKGK
eukprot:gene18926-22613_t